jgi:hypothetical protein
MQSDWPLPLFVTQFVTQFLPRFFNPTALLATGSKRRPGEAVSVEDEDFDGDADDEDDQSQFSAKKKNKQSGARSDNRQAKLFQTAATAFGLGGGSGLPTLLSGGGSSSAGDKHKLDMKKEERRAKELEMRAEERQASREHQTTLATTMLQGIGMLIKSMNEKK